MGLHDRLKTSNGSSSATAELLTGAQQHESSAQDRKSTRLNSSHSQISYAVFCLKKKKKNEHRCPHSLLLTDERFSLLYQFQPRRNIRELHPTLCLASVVTIITAQTAQEYQPPP